jgi:hypothetical protein
VASLFLFYMALLLFAISDQDAKSDELPASAAAASGCGA